jgi:hypothetical protein
VVQEYLQFQFGLDEYQEKFEKLIDLPRDIFSGYFYMYFSEVDGNIGLVSFFTHHLGGEGGCLQKLPHLVIKILYVSGFDGEDGEVVQPLLEDRNRLLPKTGMLGVEHNVVVILTKFNLYLVFRLDDGNVLGERFPNDSLNGDGFGLDDALVVQVDDGDVELRDLLNDGEHLRDGRLGEGSRVED